MKTASVEKYTNLPTASRQLVDSVLSWWQAVQYMTDGEYGEHNVFDEDPRFVTMAMIIKNPEESEVSLHGLNFRFEQFVKECLMWWNDFPNVGYEYNVFDEEPDFIVLAKRLNKNDQSYELGR